MKESNAQQLQSNKPDSRSVEKNRVKRSLWLAAGCIVTLALIGLVVTVCANRFGLELVMQGDAELTLQAGQDYTEPGIYASFAGTLLMREPVAVEVTTEGAVDTGEVGVYTLNYTASYKLDYLVGSKVYSQSKHRTVRVIDTQKPVITLRTDPQYYTLPGETYREEGYTAVDNRDGDITHLVKRTETDSYILYQVTDREGNTAEVRREIVYKDPVPPEITLLGGEKMEVILGRPFTDPGYTATDNYDGEVSHKVQVTGAVDVMKLGDQSLVYTATDESGNTATVTRTVTVIETPPLPQIPPADAIPAVPSNGKTIYLTFDDGPSGHTERLLDVLDRYGVKVTFFVVDSGRPDLLARMAASGHTVAVHSQTHDYYQIYASEEAYFNDLYAMQQIVQDATGRKPMLVRFPGGSSNTVSSFNPGIMTRLTALVKQQGYRYFDWNVDSYDAGGALTANQVLYNVISGVSQQTASIVLQHDIHGFSVDAVDMIIRWGLANGYTFLPLNENSPWCEHGVNN